MGIKASVPFIEESVLIQIKTDQNPLVATEKFHAMVPDAPYKSALMGSSSWY
jgi:hypothetical protein